MERSFAHSRLAALALSFLALIWVSPFAWLVLGSIDIEANGQLRIPTKIGIDNFVLALSGAAGQQLLNSIYLAVGTATLTVVVAAAAAYPLSRVQLPGRNALLWGLVMLRMLPETGTIVPTFYAAKAFGGLNMPGMIVSMTVLSMPFALLLLKNFFDTVPIELEEAAFVEGATLLQILRHVVIPMSRSGVVVVWFFTFTNAWNAFLLPFIFARTDTGFPMSVGLFTAFGQYGGISYGFLTAYSLIYSAPAVGVYFLLRRSLNTGFAGVGVKG
jgi:multiple sugar transport system permease protein